MSDWIPDLEKELQPLVMGTENSGGAVAMGAADAAVNGVGAAVGAARATTDEILVAETSLSDVGAGLKRTCA